MLASWEYAYQYQLNRLFGQSTLNDPMALFMIIIFLIAGIFLIGMIRALYQNYIAVEAIETLLFLIGMLCLLIGVVFNVFRKLSYSTWGAPELGDILYLITNFSVLAGILCVDAFSVRVTFPEHFKAIFSFVLTITPIFLGILIWAVIQGPPNAHIVNFEVAISFEMNIIRNIFVLPICAIPATLFLYYAIKIRKENKPNSSRSFWLGMGVIFFDLAVLVPQYDIELNFFQIFFLPAAITFYVCFSMPDWFKRKIEWPK
ncbi:MAG: hypothetical protein ACFFCM_04300 [Promethearchaeota archaeon]